MKIRQEQFHIVKGESEYVYIIDNSRVVYEGDTVTVPAIVSILRYLKIPYEIVMLSDDDMEKFTPQGFLMNEFNVIDRWW